MNKDIDVKTKETIIWNNLSFMKFNNEIVIKLLKKKEIKINIKTILICNNSLNSNQTFILYLNIYNIKWNIYNIKWNDFFKTAIQIVDILSEAKNQTKQEWANFE